MRTAFASLILAAGVATAAQAQTAATPAVPAQPAVQAPATPATPAVPTAPAADPMAGAQPGAAPAQANPAEPPPTLPTTGDAAEVLSVLENVCVPIVRGQNLDDVAKARGWKRNRKDGSWSTPLGGQKHYAIIIYAQGANKNVCQGEVRYAHGQEEPIVKGINVWSFLHKPMLQLQANYVATDADGIKRVRRSWEYFDEKQSIAVNFSTMKKPDDTPLNKNYDTAALFYQERTF
jgi:hypothetical protein